MPFICCLLSQIRICRSEIPKRAGKKQRSFTLLLLSFKLVILFLIKSADFAFPISGQTFIRAIHFKPVSALLTLSTGSSLYSARQTAQRAFTGVLAIFPAILNCMTYPETGNLFFSVCEMRRIFSSNHPERSDREIFSPALPAQKSLPDPISVRF